METNPVEQSKHENIDPKAGPRCPFAHLMTPPKSSLADTLKDRTKEAHARAEKHPIQGRMVTGKCTRAEYAGWLGQMLPVWSAVDAGLAALANRDPRAASMLKPYHVHAARIEADLAFLGDSGAAHAALPATMRFVQMVNQAAASPAVIGVWYVLEGSANGGRYIAKALSRGLEIAGPEGLTSFDPHGERQREFWQAWRSDVDAQDFSEPERTAIVAAADATFDAVYDMMEDLTPATQTS